MSVRIINSDALTALRTLPERSVQCVVTSPPYFQLRNYGVDGQIGLERTPAAFLDALYAVFDEVKRVLRDDGCVFVNLGDSYAGSSKGPSKSHNAPTGGANPHSMGLNSGATYGARPKSLLLIPERFAIGMADRGWIVRSQIVWAKKSAMPESVRDRPTSAWEPIWMFVKQPRYYWDADAVRQPQTGGTHARGNKAAVAPKIAAAGSGIKNNGSFLAAMTESAPADGMANLRNVWHLSPEPSRDEHYAAYPTEIPRRCILAATSEKGQCPACGAPWARVVERERGTPATEVRGYQAGVTGTTPKVTHGKGSPNAVVGANYMQMTPRGGVRSETTGWAPTCRCVDAGEPVPQTVLDPFLGSGTTALVADRLERDAIGIELNPQYAAMARRRIEGDAPMFADVEVAS